MENLRGLNPHSKSPFAELRELIATGFQVMVDRFELQEDASANLSADVVDLVERVDSCVELTSSMTGELEDIVDRLMRIEVKLDTLEEMTDEVLHDEFEDEEVGDNPAVCPECQRD